METVEYLPKAWDKGQVVLPIALVQRRLTSAQVIARPAGQRPWRLLQFYLVRNEQYA